MKQHLNEVKRMQQLAGLITESQLNELNEPEKELVDAILGEGINEGKFDPKEILAKLMAVAKKGLLTASIISTVLASCNFGPSTEETIQNRLDQYKTIDSMQLVQKEKDEAFKKDIDSLKQDLKAIEYQVGQQPQQESQLNEVDHLAEVRQLVREVIKESILNEQVDVRALVKIVNDAKRAGQEIAVDGEPINLWVASMGLLRTPGGRHNIYDVAAGDVELTIDGVPVELPAYVAPTPKPKVDTRTPEEIEAAAQAFRDRYGPGGGQDTFFGRRTFD